ncbi:hypothetical protein [Holdemanella biformis]
MQDKLTLLNRLTFIVMITRVRESKLYRTEEETKKVVQQHQNANKWR